MRSVLNGYFTFRKAGFFKSSKVILVILLLPSLITLLFNRLRGDELPTILYVLFSTGDILFAVLVPLFIVGNYNFNKYRLYTTLPIKYDDLFKYLYIETYSIIILAFSITGIINFAIFDLYSLFVQIFKMVLALGLSNIFIPRVATEEFITNSEMQQTNLVVIAMSVTFAATMFVFILILAGPETMSSFFDNTITNIVIISLSLAGTVIAVLTLKKSYFNTVNKVRLMKYAIGNNNTNRH